MHSHLALEDDGLELDESGEVREDLCAHLRVEVLLAESPRFQALKHLVSVLAVDLHILQHLLKVLSDPSDHTLFFLADAKNEFLDVSNEVEYSSCEEVLAPRLGSNLVKSVELEQELPFYKIMHFLHRVERKFAVQEAQFFVFTQLFLGF